MIIVTIELLSARNGTRTKLGEMQVCNDATSTDPMFGDYTATVMRKGTNKPLRRGEVKNYPRLSYNVWRLIARAILACFPEEKAK